MNNMNKLWLVVLMLSGLSGCTSVIIDELDNSVGADVTMKEDETIVVLGRRHAGDYETEVDLISCVGDSVASDGIKVIPESEFIDRLYPHFEPRTAPMHVAALGRLVDRAEISQIMDEYNIRHIVWIDGQTETTASSGSIGCTIGVGGAGCFGFGTFDRESEYEATIWDYGSRKMLGKISADASGTSYLPAVVVPIPIIARVQTGACKGMADQITSFLTAEDN